MMRMDLRAVIGGVLLALVMLLAGCGTTIEAQQNRFAKNSDTMEALAAKKPMMKTAVMDKLVGFKAERDKIVAAGGEKAPTELARLNSRMEEYVRKIDPSMAPQKSTASSKKLNTTTTNTPPGSGTATPAAAPAGKLGGGSNTIPAPGTATPAPAGKLGGTPAPGTPTGTAPAGKLGGTPAPGTAPAPSGKLGQ